MKRTSLLQGAIEVTAREWPHLSALGDPNTIDVYWHACKVQEYLNLKLPTVLTQKQMGLRVMDYVNNEFVPKSRFVRECSPRNLVERARRLLQVIQEENLLRFSPSGIYVVALYTWHGCICMAKCLRPTYVLPVGGEAPYTIDKRREGYDIIRESWRREENRGNLWVRYGVSLARAWEIKNGKQPNKNLIEHWVPKDSPYWDAQ